jgi:hypothetical protein
MRITACKGPKPAIVITGGATIAYDVGLCRDMILLSQQQAVNLSARMDGVDDG